MLIFLCDKLFSVIPFLILFSYFLDALNDIQHFYILLRFITLYITSYFLKISFKIKRNRKSYKYVEWPIVSSFKNIKSNYGFPSSHTFFYTGYFILRKNIYTFLLFTIGCYLRVYCQHHTYKEVLISIFVAIIIINTLN